MIYCVNPDGTITVPQADAVMCQPKIHVSDNNGSFHAASKASLAKLFD